MDEWWNGPWGLWVVYGAIATLLLMLYLWFFYLEDAVDAFRAMRRSGYGSGMALVAAAVVVVLLVAFYELPW